MANRKELIKELVERARNFRLCGPSDDPDEQTAVTSGYLHLVIQFKRLVSPILTEESASRLNAIEVDMDSIYSVYEASAELDALLPEIEDALEMSDEVKAPLRGCIVDPQMIARLSGLKATRLDVSTLVQMCREINSSYAHGNVLATVLLMRTVLNHVPPAFGYNTFEQVQASVGKSLKENFGHLENGLRKIADFHAHRKIAHTEVYPSMAQVEPFKPQFEVLLQEVMARA
jgi:hypothetical protein